MVERILQLVLRFTFFIFSVWRMVLGVGMVSIVILACFVLTVTKERRKWGSLGLDERSQCSRTGGIEKERPSKLVEVDPRRTAHTAWHGTRWSVGRFRRRFSQLMDCRDSYLSLGVVVAIAEQRE